MTEAEGKMDRWPFEPETKKAEEAKEKKADSTWISKRSGESILVGKRRVESTTDRLLVEEMREKMRVRDRRYVWGI